MEIGVESLVAEGLELLGVEGQILFHQALNAQLPGADWNVRSGAVGQDRPVVDQMLSGRDAIAVGGRLRGAALRPRFGAEQVQVAALPIISSGLNY